MADLVEKFFKEGLTEAEEQALSEAIWASEDEAEKFAQFAREAYQRYGFPEPRMPEPPQPPPSSRGGFGPWLGILALTAVLAAAFHYKDPMRSVLARIGVFHGISGSKPAPFKANSSGLRSNHGKSLHPFAPEGRKAGSDSFSAARSGVAPLRPQAMAERVPDAAEQSRDQAQVTQGPAASTPHSAPAPINLDQNPSSDYSSLSVVVYQSKAGPLAVRVLDMRGIQILPLYNGILGPGHWVFQWDGRLADGQPADPGFYQIEVRAGLFVERKTIQIH